MELKARVCPICGSTFVVEKSNSYYCRSCGITLDKTDNESEEEKRKYILRLNAETELSVSPPRFDTALSNFELLIKEFPNWSVAYWGYLRAKYGIKYERDAGDKSIPCCYEGEYHDFRNDKDYQKALELAETEELRAKYESEAERIAKTWKEWVEKAKKYDYDVFISFKATDENGQPTKDLYDATNLNAFLVGQGIKTFFSPISMKEHAGEPYYDAYIYNALEKAQVLIVYGSKSDYFKTTWIQNEWTRYLKQIMEGKKQDNSLLIIYNGFNPGNELPAKLARRQMLDGSSGNLYSDVLELVKKVLGNSKKKDVIEHIVVQQVEQSKKIDKKTNIELVTLNNDKKDRKEFAKTTQVHSQELNKEGSGLYTPTINDKLSVASTCLDAERYEEALIFYNEVIKDDPENGQALIGAFAASHKQREIYSFINGQTKTVWLLPIDQVKEFNETKDSIVQLIECADNKDAAERILLWVYHSYIERGFNCGLPDIYSSAFYLVYKYNCIARSKAIEFFSKNIAEIVSQFNNPTKATAFLIAVSNTFTDDDYDNYMSFLRESAKRIKMQKSAEDCYTRWVKLLMQHGDNSRENMYELIYKGKDYQYFFHESISTNGLNIAKTTIANVKEYLGYLEKDDAENVLAFFKELIIKFVDYIISSSGGNHLELIKAIREYYFFAFQYQFKERKAMIYYLNRKLLSLFAYVSPYSFNDLLDFAISIIENDQGDADHHIDAFYKLGRLFIDNGIYEKEIFNKAFEYQENNFKGLSGIYVCDIFNSVPNYNLINKEELENVLKYASSEEEQQEFVKYLLEKIIKVNTGIFADKCIDAFDLLIKYYAGDQAQYIARFALLVQDKDYEHHTKIAIIRNYLELSLTLKPRRNIEARFLALLIKYQKRNEEQFKEQTDNFSKDSQEFKELIFACAEDRNALIKYTEMADYIEKRIATYKERQRIEEEKETKKKAKELALSKRLAQERAETASNGLLGFLVLLTGVTGSILIFCSDQITITEEGTISGFVSLTVIGCILFLIAGIWSIKDKKSAFPDGASIFFAFIGLALGITLFFIVKDNGHPLAIAAAVLFALNIIFSSIHIALKKKVY